MSPEKDPGRLAPGTEDEEVSKIPDADADPSKDRDKDAPGSTLWCGDLAAWMDERFLVDCLGKLALPAVDAKVIRNRANGRSEGYGFVEFADREAAAGALASLNGRPVPGTTQVWRLNWASFGIRGPGDSAAALHVAAPAPPPAEEFSILVGDLSPTVTDVVLLETFRCSFESARSAKVVVDADGPQQGLRLRASAGATASCASATGPSATSR